MTLFVQETTTNYTPFSHSHCALLLALFVSHTYLFLFLCFPFSFLGELSTFLDFIGVPFLSLRFGKSFLKNMSSSIWWLMLVPTFSSSIYVSFFCLCTFVSYIFTITKYSPFNLKSKFLAPQFLHLL